MTSFDKVATGLLTYLADLKDEAAEAISDEGLVNPDDPFASVLVDEVALMAADAWNGPSWYHIEPWGGLDHFSEIGELAIYLYEMAEEDGTDGMEVYATEGPSY